MKIAVMPCRSAPRGLKVLFGCLLLCLLTCMPASAQEENITWVGGDLYDYAEFSFAVPNEFADLVEAESLSEENYSEGRYVEASLRFNGSIVWILLLYPCEVLEEELNDAGLKSAIEGFNAVLNQTVYITTPLNISDRPAIGGQAPPPLDNFAMAAYQPSNQTVSMIFIDVNVTQDLLEYFPESLQINVNESSSPLWPGYCGEEVSDVASAEVDSEPQQTEQIVQTDQAEQTGSAPNKEQMEADLEAIGEKLEALKRW
jgi:hypothetical protein